jgi:TatD DNase family protein
MLIDTHCHLNDPAFEKTLSDVMARAREAGVHGFVVPSYDLESLGRTAELASSCPEVIFPALGIHPWHVSKGIDYKEIFSFIRQHPPAGIGEIGLDFSPECPPQEVQVKSLVRQLEWAEEFDLPVTIHCRKAYDAFYQVIADRGGRIRGALHSFSGSKEMMFKLIDLGFYIGFSGSVTRSTAKKYQKNARAAPLDRILLETDAPSIATETTIASEVEPRHVVEVARKIAELRSLSLEEVSEKTTENARRLFALTFDNRVDFNST